MVDERDLPISQEDADPTEEVGADHCEVDATGAEYEAGDQHLDGAEECEFKFSDELDDGMVMTATPMVISEADGMPVQADNGELRTPPPFTHKTMVCVEDARSFVEELLEPDQDTSLHFEQRERFDSNGVEAEPMVFASDKVIVKWGRKCVEQKSAYGVVYVPVKPVRPRCIHYMRQMMNNEEVVNEDEFGHRYVFRNCTMRRSVGGAFMSVGNCAVYACDYRDPPDPTTNKKYLDGPDEERLISLAHLIRVPLFGLGRATDACETKPENK